jgi:hypothetical protein
MPRPSNRLIVVGFIALIGTIAALAQEKKDKPAATHPGFEKLKTLKGEWVEVEDSAAEQGEKSAKGEKAEKAEKTGDKDTSAPPAVVYKVVSAGSAVQETLFPGTPHEMITMYHLDGPDLVLTHYCAAGNQPHMKAEKSANVNKLVFKFTGGTNIDPAKDGHMHDLTMTFIDADHIRSEWTFYADGKKGDTKTFELTRKKN